MIYNFALIGVAGYIAPKHLKAIKETGQNLVAALDKNDSVGIMDNFFPEASFFTEFERFDRHFELLRRSNQAHNIHYVSICSPNYLHDAHIRFALRQNAHAVSEKPLVLNPWNVEALQMIEKETDKKVNTILQLRLHPSIIELKKKIEQSPRNKRFDIELIYITPRGRWYQYSWKGDVLKSGGVATNIGVHFFDMLIWIFGKVQENVLHVSAYNKAAGLLELEKARIKWFLSIDKDDLPVKQEEGKNKAYRSITLDGKEIEFSEGFTDLHTQSYKKILEGNGYGIEETKPSIETVFTIRNSKAVGLKGEYHPILKKVKF
jgi:UDP-N-acetyl-2-amino-2-deoxyglucuronate dehydrogenase